MAQAKFSGLGLARSFSDQIWAVDKGEAWKIGAGYPLQWVVLDTLDKAGKDQLMLKVIGQYFDSQSFVLIEQPLELVPQDQARGLLGARSDSLLKVFMLTTSVSLPKSGCLQVQAVITNQQTGTPLYNGETFVSVK
jgi:hypothetical protein